MVGLVDGLSAEPKRVLVVRLGAIGDALRVLPAVRRLRIERPAVTIGWVVENWVYPVLAGNPNVDCFHVLDRDALRGGPFSALGEIWRRSREIRAAQYDTVLDFHGRFKSGVVGWVSGAPTRIGYGRAHSTEGNWRFTNLHVDLDDESENRVLRFLHLLQPLGIDAVFDPGATGVYIDEGLRRRARAWYASCRSPQLAVYPGSSRKQARHNRWPVHKWVDLLQRLAREGVTAVIFWGPDEGAYVRAIATQAGAAGVLAPATTLSEMMAMLGCFEAFIGTNSAAMHMAWLQGVPTAMFSGPAPARTDAPMAPLPSRVLRARAHSRTGVSKRRQPEVVDAVSVDEALDAVRALLRRAPDPRCRMVD